MDTALLQFPITSITLYFKSFCSNRTILTINSTKKVYIDLRDSLGYTNEKLVRNDSKFTVTIELKTVLMYKMRLSDRGYTNGEYLYMLDDGGLTLKYKTYTIKLQDDALEA